MSDKHDEREVKPLQERFEAMRLHSNRIGLRAACLGIVAGFVMATSLPTQAQSVGDFAASVAGCAIIGESRASMPVEPLFQRDGGQCVAMNPRGSSILDSLSWFEDASCSTRVGFVPTPLVAFCAQIADGAVLGTADNIVPSTWTLTPGSRINVGVLSLNGVPQPYLQRILYATFPTPSGQCELEMRVYKSHPAATGERSLVALHGGAWRFRGFGYFGLEMTIPHLVNQGFVVYAPFYRLLDDVDGSPGCQNAELTDLVRDAETALNWVQANASRFGSSGKPVVFGQSAGAHLAGSLWLNRRDEISGAILLYPPTDFTDFTQRVQNGDYTNEEGVDILELVLGTDASEANFTASPIFENSYPQRVAEQPDDLAPMMLLHGQSDTLVEDTQSIRLCNAIAGRDIAAELSEESDGLRTIVSCEPDNSTAAVESTMHLFDQGRHAMDLCIDGNLLAEQTCPAGSNASANVIGDSVRMAAVFAQEAFDASVEASLPGAVDPPINDETDSDPVANTDNDVDASANDNLDEVVVASSGGGSFFGSVSAHLLWLMVMLFFIKRCAIAVLNQSR